jgi:threonine dehydratase
LELVEQISEPLDVVLLAVGGGSLMAGVAPAVEGTVRVVGVEPESAIRIGTIVWDVAQAPKSVR